LAYHAILNHQLKILDLEDLLLQHPDVDDAAVIGVYDPQQATEVPRAYSKYLGPCGVMHIE
jgi:acyl-coenzyme A synthetase/AMP-(fatty) acid ligase